MYLGDIPLSQTIDFTFTTYNVATGAPHALSGGTVSVYVGNSTTQTTTGVTLTADFDGVTGLNHVRIATSDAFYATGSDFHVILTAGTVNGVSAVGSRLAEFSIQNRSALRPTTSGRTLDVSAGGEAGVDWANVGSPTTTLNLSGTTVKTATDVETDTQDIQSRLPAALVGGRIDANVGAISSDATAADNLEAILDGTGGVTLSLGSLLVSGVTTFTGAVTANGSVAINGGMSVINLGGTGLAVIGTSLGMSISGATGDGLNIDGATGCRGVWIEGGAFGLKIDPVDADGVGFWVDGGLDGGAAIELSGHGTGQALLLSQFDPPPGNLYRPGEGAIVGNVTGNISGSVGSVTGNVGGNVTGSVGSVAAGGITASSIATGAIDADALAADAANEIADALLDRSNGIETSVTPRGALRAILATTAGRIANAATTTNTFKNPAGDTDRVTATVDSSGNRSAITLNV